MSACQVHDNIVMGDLVWSVTGIFLGGEIGESVIGLQVTGLRHDASAYGKALPELFVPEAMVESLLSAGLATVQSTTVKGA